VFATHGQLLLVIQIAGMVGLRLITTGIDATSVRYGGTGVDQKKSTPRGA
jgi:hypothetical protein